ncbi:MAG: hypothetical protein GWP17_00525 [Aquificales bacterium]|nr:hypothetical protein [Aquificales bacterium]
MAGKVWFLLAALAVWGVGGCAPEAPPLPTQMATAVLPTVITPESITEAPPASPTPILQPTVIILPTATVLPAASATAPAAAATASPVMMVTAAVQPSPFPSPLPPTPIPPLPMAGSGGVIGYSAGGRPLTNYQFGNGFNQIVLVGGMHGGYEWNTILLAYRMIDYFTQNLDEIPETVTLHIIPSANPDGQFVITGRDCRFSEADIDPTSNNFSGRFNDNGVDLNRNWDCRWQTKGVWRDQEIDAGAYPFSEPETAALRDFFLALEPTAVILWHSAANGTYAAGCPDLYQPAYALAEQYGAAADYPVYESFAAYQVTGDASDWLALQGIPAITVELKTHEGVDWDKNMAGITAVLDSR